MTMPEMLIGRVFCHRVGQRRFDDVLDDGVNREHHVQAVARLDVLIAQATTSSR